MSENEDPNTDPQDPPATPVPPKTHEIPPDVLKAAIDEALKPIKEKLNGAYSARDEALRKAAEAEDKISQVEIERLKEQGKVTEALEKELAAERAKADTLSKRNTELTRDVELKGHLGSLQFRNEQAAKMAYKEIVPQLIQGENGLWTHKSGQSVTDYIKSFAENEANTFLFKAKESSGSGVGSPTRPSSSSPKRLSEMSQEEVLKMAAEGKLPNQNR